MTPSSVSNWLFTSRQNGQFVLAQRPNPALAVWLAAVVWRAVTDPTGMQRATIDGTAAGALIVWALDEVIRGVNPFRRLLGVVVVVPALVGLVSRLN